MAMHTANDEASRTTVGRCCYAYPTAFIKNLLIILVQNGWTRCYRAENHIAPAHVAEQSSEFTVSEVPLIERICRIKKFSDRVDRCRIRVPLTAAFLGGALLLFV